MDKKVVKLSIFALLIIGANIGIFVKCDEYFSTFWVCYVFGMVAALITVYVEVFIDRKGTLAFTFPIRKQTYLYCAIAVALAFLLNRLLKNHPFAALMIQLIVLVAYLALLLTFRSYNSFVNKEQSVRQANITKFNSILSSMDEVVKKLEYTDENRKTIIHAYESLASGQVKSGSETFEVEEKISLKIQELKNAISGENKDQVKTITADIEILADERKRILANKKHF